MGYILNGRLFCNGSAVPCRRHFHTPWCSKSRCILLTPQKAPAGDSTESKIKSSSLPVPDWFRYLICQDFRLEGWSWKGCLSLYVASISDTESSPVSICVYPREGLTAIRGCLTCLDNRSQTLISLACMWVTAKRALSWNLMFAAF